MRSFILAVLLVVSAVALVQTPDTMRETNSHQIATSHMKGKAILILLKQQRLYAVEDGQTIYNFHVSTGRDGLSTPVGKTVVQRKLRYNRALPEFGGGSIPYTLRIYLYDPKVKRRRRINIHAYSSVPTRPASHGCVRLAYVSAKKLFDWAEKGTPVIVMEGPPAKKRS